MRVRTRAFEYAAERGWSIAELSERSGLPLTTLYKLRAQERQPGPRVIQGMLRAFPESSYEKLFMVVDCTEVQNVNVPVQPLGVSEADVRPAPDEVAA